jgi:hypothetical protein
VSDGGQHVDQEGVTSRPARWFFRVDGKGRIKRVEDLVEHLHRSLLGFATHIRLSESMHREYVFAHANERKVSQLRSCSRDGEHFSGYLPC